MVRPVWSGASAASGSTRKPRVPPPTRPEGAPRAGGLYSGSSPCCARAGSAKHSEIRNSQLFISASHDTINALGLGTALEHERADALARLVHRQQRTRRLADQDAAALALVAAGQRQRLQPRRHVHRVADHRVLEALPAADVA